MTYLPVYFLSSGNYKIELNTDSLEINVSYNGETIIEAFRIQDNRNHFYDSYRILSVKTNSVSLNEYLKYMRMLEVACEKIDEPEKSAFIRIWIGPDGIKVEYESEDQFSFAGKINWGKNPEENTFAVNPSRDYEYLRAAAGPAADQNDTALYDRMTDRVLAFGEKGQVRIRYNYDLKSYVFEGRTKTVELAVICDYYKNQYGLKQFKPINKNKVISGPNAGMLTYYAWLFDFDENDVREAVDVQQRELGSFGANTFVVDIEWCRNNTWGSKELDGDHFAPDKNRYPSGMKAAADYIREHGFEPQIWWGINFENRENEEILAHPEIVYEVDDDSWCGKYCIDMTHPYVLEHYLPRLFRQTKEWGFKSVKWDLLCEAIDEMELHHDKLFDPTMTSADIQRRVMEIARKEMGEDAYILYCAAVDKEHISIGADLFDACRIGRDQWSWENFHYQVLDKLCSHYPLHNVLMYNDPDSMIIAEKRVSAADTCLFDSKVRIETVTTREEAISRLTPTVLLGLVFNIGDDIRKLSCERMDMLKKSLPIADVHPKNIGFTKKQDVTSIIVQVSRPYADWTVLGVINTKEEPVIKKMSIADDLGLETGDYIAYDFWNKKTAGVFSDIIDFNLGKHETANYSIHRLSGIPQFVSTTRHMLQGTVEIEDIAWNSDECELTIEYNAVQDYSYEIVLYVPDVFAPDDEECALKEEITGRGNIYGFNTKADINERVRKTIHFSKK